MTMTSIYEAIKADSDNQVFTTEGIEPLCQVNPTAKVLLIGQAPGLKAQEKQKLFQDPSGDRLREWLGVDEQFFFFTSRDNLLFYPWIFTFQERENQVIYHLAKDKQRSGTRF